mgnify:CR=1 FL=1
MRKMKNFYPTDAADALKWIQDNEHFHGYHATRKGKEGLVLANHENDCFIPRGLLQEDAIRPSNYEITKRMFELTSSGLQILAAKYVKRMIFEFDIT